MALGGGHMRTWSAHVAGGDSPLRAGQCHGHARGDVEARSTGQRVGGLAMRDRARGEGQLFPHLLCSWCSFCCGECSMPRQCCCVIGTLYVLVPPMCMLLSTAQSSAGLDAGLASIHACMQGASWPPVLWVVGWLTPAGLMAGAFDPASEQRSGDARSARTCLVPSSPPSRPPIAPAMVADLRLGLAALEERA